MPRFVSGTSGAVYDASKNEVDEVTDLIVSGAIVPEDPIASTSKKPSTLNRKDGKSKPKSNLESFKEELKRIEEEKEERNQKKQQLCNKDGSILAAPAKPAAPLPVPLRPDPRSHTPLTLAIKSSTSDDGTRSHGSHDCGDPNTTNIYLGNLNPSVNEDDLCGLFGKFGPLASIKVMWPRTDEEKARNRNCGFVAYMSRRDAVRALSALHGREFVGYEMKLGWGKAVPIPQQPVYVPPALMEVTQPPPPSGMPFNAQLHPTDVDQIPSEMLRELQMLKDGDRHKFNDILERSTVKVVIPQNRAQLDLIHKVIEFVLLEGPMFEAMIMTREINNPDYSFLFDNQSPEHCYYRWKLFSILHGDDPCSWRTQNFKMFVGGSTWRPPPLNPFAEGMPDELLQDMTNELQSVAPTKESSVKHGKSQHVRLCGNNSSKKSSTALTKETRDNLAELLRDIDPQKKKIAESMLFCIQNSDAAEEIAQRISETLMLSETPLYRKIGRLYLLSDILHNSSARVANAHAYREAFKNKLCDIFKSLRETIVSIEGRLRAEQFRQRIFTVLNAWRDWTVYDQELLTKLKNIIIGKDSSEAENGSIEQSKQTTSDNDADDEDIDGMPMDEEQFELIRQNISRGLVTNPKEILGTMESNTNEPNMPWFGIDIGGSLVKIVFFDPRHASEDEVEVLSRVRRYLKSAKAYGSTGRRDAHLEMPGCKINGRVGTLHFIRFSTSQMPNFLAMAKGKGLAHLVKTVCATGGGAELFESDIKEQLGIVLRKSDELDSIIHGIHYIDSNNPAECYYLRNPLSDDSCVKEGYDFSKPYPYLVVNIGSGVSILAVHSQTSFSRISGSSIGGATFLGLCSLLTGCQTFDQAIDLAKDGQTTNVDKFVRDIYGGDYHKFGLSGDTVAASFGHMMSESRRKLVSPQDLARATLNMVTLNIGSLARMCALQEGIDRVVFIGNFLRVNQLSMKHLSYAVDYWSVGQMKALFLEHEGYFGAVGCFVESTAGGVR